MSWLPTGFGATLLLLPFAALLGAFYGYVGYAGYHNDIHRGDPERRRDVLITTGFAVVSVFFLRHVINGEFWVWLLDGFQGALNNSNPIVMLFLGIPLALIVIAIAFAGFAGAAMFAVKAIWRVFYYLPGFFMGLPVVISWYFVKHPAEPIVSSALRDNRRVDAKQLAVALEDGERTMSSSPPPAYFSKQQAEKAHRLAEKLDADARLAEATIQRERKRAELQDAERELKEAQRKGRGGR